MKRIFITGATGFIGSHLCAQLAAKGYALTLLVRAGDKKRTEGRPAMPAHAKVIGGSLAETPLYCEALKECHALIHLAADYRVGLPKQTKERTKMHATNVQGTLAVMDAAIKAKVPKIIYASTTAALGETHGLNPHEEHLHNSIFRCSYEESKHIAHRLIQQKQKEGAAITMAILGGVFGGGDASTLPQTFHDFLNDKLPMLPDSQSRFQLCHVSRVCQAFELLLDGVTVTGQPLAPAYLFTGQDYSMAEVIAMLSRLSNRPEPKKVAVNKLKIPAWGMHQLSRFGLKFPLSKEVMQIMDGSTYMYSSAKAQQELGWSAGDPTQELEAYMQELILGTHYINNKSTHQKQ